MGTHPIFESDFDCLTEKMTVSQIGKSGFVNEDWKYDDGEICDPKNMKKKSYAMKVTDRLDKKLKGKMCFGPKGVKNMAHLDDNLLSLHLPLDSGLKMIIDGNEFNVLGRKSEKAIIKPGSSYAIKNLTKENQFLDFILYPGPIMNKKADESGDEMTFTEEATEFQPGETELATNYTEATEFTDSTGASTRVDDEESEIEASENSDASK